jgi:surface protein
MAESFNSDLSTWNVAHVANMTGMFYGATSFNQSLCSRKEDTAADLSVKNMFQSTGCIQTNDPTANRAADTSFCTACR